MYLQYMCVPDKQGHHQGLFLKELLLGFKDTIKLSRTCFQEGHVHLSERTTIH